VVPEHYTKDDLLKYWTNSSDISGYHADFHEGHGSRSMAFVNYRGTEWEANGMGAAWYV